ncbi:MAG: hypothetical protein OYH76_16195 [Defluviicoccus sp.]|nr:hypothetical protein [Defluviicoccus sp.]MDE0277437.1 hypothetical protein [Defluviicoccus sp.]
MIALRSVRRRFRPSSPRWTPAAVLAAILLCTIPDPAHAQHPTPEIQVIQEIPIPGSVAYGMRARLGATDTYLGLTFLCTLSPPVEIEITVYFGAFPADGRPIQLAIRRSDGQILRFGPVVHAGPRSGFHSPRITDRRQAERFANAALRPGTLVSNGYRSFWNRGSRRDNRTARLRFLDCLKQSAR